MRRIRILDTTLRDGDQSPLIGFSLEEKILIGDALARCAVDTIEAGFPASSNVDYEACRILSENHPEVRIAAFCRSIPEEIRRSAAAFPARGKTSLHLTLPVSDLHRETKFGISRDDLLRRAREAVSFAAAYTEVVEMGAEDATRADSAFLADYCRVVCEAGANCVNISDTTGSATPRQFYALICMLMNEVTDFKTGRVMLSVHCHNDKGLATANTLAAIEAGCRQVETSVCGIGERAGNAPLEELAVLLKEGIMYREEGCESALACAEIAGVQRLVSSLCALGFPPFTPVSGSTAAAHASGIHQQAQLIDERSYSAFSPAVFGFPPDRITLSRHSGKAGISAWIDRFLPSFGTRQDEVISRSLAFLKTPGNSADHRGLRAHLRTEGLLIDDMPDTGGTLTISEEYARTKVTLKVDNGPDTPREISAEEENLDLALQGLFPRLGLELPRIIRHGVSGSGSRWRAAAEICLDETGERLIVEEKGVTPARALFDCFVEAAEINRAVSRKLKDLTTRIASP